MGVGVGDLLASWPRSQDFDLHHLTTQLLHLEYRYSLFFYLVCYLMMLSFADHTVLVTDQ